MKKKIILQAATSIIACLLLTVAVQAQFNTSYSANANLIGGNYNTATGYQALYNNSSGVSNIATGYKALYNNYGSNNIASGYQALYYNFGDNNIATGYQALYSNFGNNNIATGYKALYYNSAGSNNTATGYQAGYSNQGDYNVYIGFNAGYNETGSNKLYISNDSTNALIYGDFNTHQILLGKPNATGYTFKGNRTLNVLGGVLADSLRLALSSNWADYVFNDNYTLQPIKELDNYIKNNKHLPGIPTTADVKENGINIAEINTKLLEKTEELTLYIIEQQKQIDEQQKQINELKKLIMEKLKN